NSFTSAPVSGLPGGYALATVFVNGIPGVSSILSVVPSIASPIIITQPQSLTVNPGQDAAFSVTALGTAPLSYQWQFNSNTIPGATANSFTRTNAQSADAGAYSVVITNSGGSVTSSIATLMIFQPTLTILPNSTGTVIKNPDQPTYPLNSVVTLTAVPIL